MSERVQSAGGFSPTTASKSSLSSGGPQATTALGRLHAKSLGTPRDLPKAWALYSLATELGDEDARKPLAELSARLTPEQIDKGRKLLAGCKKKPGDGSTE